MYEQKMLIARIRELCKKKGLTYYLLAYRSSVPRTTLSHILDGSTKNPGIFTISKLCSGLEITLKDFFDTKEFSKVTKESK